MSDEEDKDKNARDRKGPEDRRVTIKELLLNLTPSEAGILGRWFGIDVENYQSIEGIEKRYDITRKRIREIEEKALRNLRGKGPDNESPNSV